MEYLTNFYRNQQLSQPTTTPPLRTFMQEKADIRDRKPSPQTQQHPQRLGPAKAEQRISPSSQAQEEQEQEQEQGQNLSTPFL